MSQLDLFLEEDCSAEEADDGHMTADQYNRKLNREIHRGHAAWNRFEAANGRKTRPCPCDDCLKFQTKRLYVVPNHWDSSFFHLEWLYDGHSNTEADMIMGGESFEHGPGTYDSIESAIEFARSKGVVAIPHPDCRYSKMTP